MKRMKYRCSLCKRVYWRESEKKWIPSYCSFSSAPARLYLLKNQSEVPDAEVQR